MFDMVGPPFAGRVGRLCGRLPAWSPEGEARVLTGRQCPASLWLTSAGERPARTAPVAAATAFAELPGNPKGKHARQRAILFTNDDRGRALPLRSIRM